MSDLTTRDRASALAARAALERLTQYYGPQCRELHPKAAAALELLAADMDAHFAKLGMEAASQAAHSEGSQPALITEDWLYAVGFRWHQLDRQPNKQWLLWLGNAIWEAEGGRGASLVTYEDLGIEIAGGAWTGKDHSGWYCWLRADTSHRYSRFLHVRHLRYQHEVIALVEALTGQGWHPEYHIGGSVYTEAQANQILREHERFDRVLLRDGAKWSDLEKDESRGGALPQHKCAAERAKEF